jgi:hypothetical protein
LRIIYQIGGDEMAKRGRKPLDLRNGDKNGKIIKRNYYIEERYTKALTILSALTGKELSLLVNESLCDLINKYQPKTDIDLLRLKTIQKEG